MKQFRLIFQMMTMTIWVENWLKPRIHVSWMNFFIFSLTETFMAASHTQRRYWIIKKERNETCFSFFNWNIHTTFNWPTFFTIYFATISSSWQKKNHMHAGNTGKDFLLTLNFLERNSKRVRRMPIDIKSSWECKKYNTLLLR